MSTGRQWQQGTRRPNSSACKRSGFPTPRLVNQRCLEIQPFMLRRKMLILLRNLRICWSSMYRKSLCKAEEQKVLDRSNWYRCRNSHPGVLDEPQRMAAFEMSLEKVMAKEADVDVHESSDDTLSPLSVMLTGRWPDLASLPIFAMSCNTTSPSSTALTLWHC